MCEMRLDSLSGSKFIEKSANMRCTLPRRPDLSTSCTAYAMGWKRVQTALHVSLQSGYESCVGPTYSMRKSFFSFASAISSSSSDRSNVNGFSHTTCLPACSAALALA